MRWHVRCKLVPVLHTISSTVILESLIVFARWVQRELTQEHNRSRVEICQFLLARNNDKGEAGLERIGTGDDTWVQLFEPESKEQSREWKHPGSPRTKKKFKIHPSTGKVMVTVLLGTQKALYWNITWKRCRQAKEYSLQRQVNQEIEISNSHQIQRPAVETNVIDAGQWTSTYGSLHR